MDKEYFNQVCDEVIGQRQGMNGIGTLSEKTVHSVLKSYYSPNILNHEIKVSGFVADICTGNEIIEIQTRNFDKLRRKLAAFLAFAPVTIVYPIHNIKYLRWVNPQTGEISPPRKSPKPGSPYTIFPELYKIKDYLVNPNLNLKIVMLDLEEYRFLDGWSKDKKKGSTRCDRIPTELVNEISINNLPDYQIFLPDSLEQEFTSKDYKKASGLPMHHAQTALHILHYIGAVNRVGKKGNSFVYSRSSAASSSDSKSAISHTEGEASAACNSDSVPKQKPSVSKVKRKKQADTDIASIIPVMDKTKVSGKKMSVKTRKNALETNEDTVVMNKNDNVNL